MNFTSLLFIFSAKQSENKYNKRADNISILSLANLYKLIIYIYAEIWPGSLV